MTLNPMVRDFELFKSRDNNNDKCLPPLLFFYTWDHTAITLGKIQRHKDLIIEKAKLLNIPCYTRPTGGRAVLHSGDICYTFIARQNDDEFGGTLRESFAKVNNLILGLICKVFNIDQRVLNTAWRSSSSKAAEKYHNCFQCIVDGEGTINYKNKIHKILGAAQLMGQVAFLQQGSIQVNRANDDLDIFKNTLTLSEIINNEGKLPLNELCSKFNNLKSARSFLTYAAVR